MVTAADAWPALALLGLIVLMPWCVTWIKRRGWVGLKSTDHPMQLVSVLAVGPQQKVVTVAVNLGPHSKWLILGVTPQSVTTLDILETQPSPPVVAGIHEEISR